MTNLKRSRSTAVRLKQTTLLSTPEHGYAKGPDVLGHLSESTRKAVLDLGRRREYAIGDLLFSQGVFRVRLKSWKANTFNLFAAL